jgi:hypothetical protein
MFCPSNVQPQSKDSHGSREEILKTISVPSHKRDSRHPIHQAAEK